MVAFIRSFTFGRKRTLSGRNPCPFSGGCPDSVRIVSQIYTYFRFVKQVFSFWMINFVYSDNFLRFWMRMSSKRKRSQTVARKSAAVVRIIRIVGRGGAALRTGAVGGGLRVNWIPRPVRFAKGMFSFGRAAPRRSSNKFGSALGLHYLCRGIEKMRSC